MINVHISGIATPQRRATPIRQPGAAGFWMIFAVEAIFVAGALALVLALILPTRAPLARSGDIAAVRDAVWARVHGTINDPLVEISPGISVRSSSVRGFALNGRTYYYYFEGQPSFDPRGRGAVAERDIEVVLRDTDGPKPLVIYEINH